MAVCGRSVVDIVILKVVHTVLVSLLIWWAEVGHRLCSNPEHDRLDDDEQGSAQTGLSQAVALIRYRRSRS
ncbi:hypothetical protein CIW52_28755 [Mycolicibacterium sp. P9-64]|nr:hypothetical protein CIW52_28755 [Mycolicibacterium sp. P9-64]